MTERAIQLRLAVAAFDKGNLIEAAETLETSDNPMDRENAVNCRHLAFGGAAHMIQTLGYLLRQHLEMAETFKEQKTANKASDATSEPAPGADSSAHQG